MVLSVSLRFMPLYGVGVSLDRAGLHGIFRSFAVTQSPLSSLVAPCPQFVRAKLLPQISDRKTKSDAMDIPDTGTPVEMGRAI